MSHPIFEFELWLIKTHPEVKLLPHQWEWVLAMERGTRGAWMGMASGKTFTMKLYREFQAWTLPIEELEGMWMTKPERQYD